MSTHEVGLDCVAVASALGIEEYALMANGVFGPVGIELAAKHPDAVTELILCDAMADIASSYLGPVLRTQATMNEVERETGELLPFNVWERLIPHEELEQFLELANAKSEHLMMGTQAQQEWSAEELLGDVVAPTLVFSSRSPVGTSLPEARLLTAGITNSRLHVVDGNVSPYFSDQKAILEAIDDLLKPDKPTAEPVAEGFRTVVFTDIVESTAYLQRVGDEAGRTAVRELETLVASFATDHGGRVIKNLGDGSLVSFGSNSSAIAFALDLQDACRDGPLYLRVGMAAGEPIQEDGDIHGAVVAQASRIGDIGEAGEVIVSDAVCQLAVGKGFSFEPRGDVDLKGFDQPQKVWKVTQTPRP
jgi:class 3 adenylate cyclase